MKVEAFVKVLRKIIREEVRQVVKEELKSIKPVLNERQTVTSAKKVAPKTTTQKNVSRNYPLVTIDSALNNILKETADSMRSRPSEEYEEWPDMNANFGTTADLAGFGQATPDFFDDEAPGYYPTSNDPTAAFMKDYSNVLKSAEQKSQGYRG